MFARQDGATTSNANVTVMYGAEPTTAGMTNSIVAATGLNNVYQEIAGSFVPETTGESYIGSLPPLRALQGTTSAEPPVS